MSPTGLDMYLRARKYVSGYRFMSDDTRNEYDRTVELFGVSKFIDPETPSGHVDFTVGYWRKANAIHGWFVHHVQEGEDECRPWYVSRDKLRELKDLCQSTLLARQTVGVNAKIAAEENLPPTEGFFFGTYEIDDWYWEDIERTIEIIERALSMPDEWDFEYQSSW